MLGEENCKSQICTLFPTKNSIIRNLMSKISLYVWGWGLGVWLVGCTYTHLLKIYSLNSL